MISATPRPLFGLPRWAQVTLIGSLALNFLLIGLAAGVGMKASEPRHMGMTGFVAGEVRAMTGEHAHGRPAETDGAAWKQRRAERREAWLEIASMLTAPTVDAASFRTAFEEMRASRERVWAHRRAELAEAMAGLSASDRAKLAARIRERMGAQ